MSQPKEITVEQGHSEPSQTVPVQGEERVPAHVEVGPEGVTFVRADGSSYVLKTEAMITAGDVDNLMRMAGLVLQQYQIGALGEMAGAVATMAEAIRGARAQAGDPQKLMEAAMTTALAKMREAGLTPPNGG